MVGIELTPLGGITLWIRVVGLSRPSVSLSNTFNDGNHLYWLDIEVVFQDSSTVG